MPSYLFFHTLKFIVISPKINPTHILIVERRSNIEFMDFVGEILSLTKAVSETISLSQGAKSQWLFLTGETSLLGIYF